MSRKSKRLSAISATNVNKAYTVNTGRKNSLPPVMDIFVRSKPGLSYVTFAEFRKNDEYPRYQITILTTLQKQENKLRQIGIVKNLEKSNLKGKKGTLQLLNCNKRSLLLLVDTDVCDFRTQINKRDGSHGIQKLGYSAKESTQHIGV